MAGVWGAPCGHIWRLGSPPKPGPPLQGGTVGLCPPKHLSGGPASISAKRTAAASWGAAPAGICACRGSSPLPPSGPSGLEGQSPWPRPPPGLCTGHHVSELLMYVGTPRAQTLTDVPPSAQEVLENLRDRWYQADSPPPDLLLTEEEFLSFLHPEHSRGMLKFMVKEIVRDLGEARAAGLLAASSQPSWGRAAWAGPGLERPRRPHSCPKREGEALSGASGHSWVPGRSCEMHPFWFG